ncbi:NAD-dependent epimerase/dehydratase family protein [Nonomuraea recticatena]|uniref:NAD-dependent epimerase/dehydratase family protein n=1 Tax=Nonomuraea recticatena TaxID=46178 RepID=UPI00360C724F
MRVLLAGATGAIGRPLLSALAASGHEVIAVIRDPAKRRLVADHGALPVIADVMDRDGLLRAVDGHAADVVMHQATALREAGRRLRPDDPTILLRGRGTEHLLEAARAVGARRFVTQSLITGYGYRDHGTRVLTENDVFGLHAGNVGDLVTDSSVATERQVFAADGIEGIALRYGMFYGRHAFSDMFADLMRKRAPVLPRGRRGPRPSSTWRTRRRPRWRPWNAAVTGRRTTSWTTSPRAGGPSSPRSPEHTAPLVLS